MSPLNSKKEKIKKQVVVDDEVLNILMVLVAAILGLLIITGLYFLAVGLSSMPSSPFPDVGSKPVSGESSYPFRQEISIDLPDYKEDSATISDITSEYAALFDTTTGQIIASKRSTGSTATMYPASMTKIMTLIVVVENLKSEESLNDVLEIKTPRGEHYGYGFNIGEKLTVKDLIYASVLQSDGVACITLAEYIAGSESAFVKLMNQKVAELGLLEGDAENLPSTHFTNCSGLHDDLHFSTAYDMAVIMAYAMKNTFCAEVLTTLKYVPSETFRPGEGCTFWHMLLHNRLNDGATQPSTATIIGGKTGWTGEDSGYCIASYAEGKNGHKYVLITAKAEVQTGAVIDTVNIYQNYAK